MLVQDLQNTRIVNYPDPILMRAGREVIDFDDELKEVAQHMLALMNDAKGVGLAAPQIGLSIRLFVCNPTGEAKDSMAFVNPMFTELTGAEEREEGCLSIPNVTVNVRRATQVTMQANDLEGRPVEARATNFVARIWQHEVDHLNGRLIIDHMSASDEIANRRAMKQLKDQYKKNGNKRRQ
jgi:peptide deformylase